ncbi:hypothetical protein [Larkinella arboricola]
MKNLQSKQTAGFFPVYQPGQSGGPEPVFCKPVTPTYVLIKRCRQEISFCPKLRQDSLEFRKYGYLSCGIITKQTEEYFAGRL